MRDGQVCGRGERRDADAGAGVVEQLGQRGVPPVVGDLGVGGDGDERARGGGLVVHQKLHQGEVGAAGLEGVQVVRREEQDAREGVTRDGVAKVRDGRGLAHRRAQAAVAQVRLRLGAAPCHEDHDPAGDKDHDEHDDRDEVAIGVVARNVGPLESLTLPGHGTPPVIQRLKPCIPVSRRGYLKRRR